MVSFSLGASLCCGGLKWWMFPIGTESAAAPDKCMIFSSICGLFGLETMCSLEVPLAVS